MSSTHHVTTPSPWVKILPLRTPTLPPATHTNCVWLSQGDGGFVLIDPGTPYPDEQQRLFDAIAQVAGDGERLTAVWLTHHHKDHIGAARAVAERYGAPICCHRETAHLLSGTLAVNRLLEAGERLATGPGEAWVRALYTPGHAPGHLCFLEERSGILVAGDMVAGVGTIIVDPPEGNMRQYLDSLRLLKAAGAQSLIPAHGDAIDRVEEKLDEYLAHRLERERLVWQAARTLGPATPESLVAAAYPDIAPLLYPLAARSLLAHLEKLVEEGCAAEVSPGRFVALGTDPRSADTHG